MKVKITLYQDTPFNETYQNVFSLAKRNNKTILELFLEQLHSVNFELDNVYYENDGEFVFDYSFYVTQISAYTNIYRYNYMKVEEIDGEGSFTRYCFVNSIKIKNEVVYLSYKEDVWHSYIGEVAGINFSYQSRTRYKGRLSSGEPIELPFNYDGNDKLSINSISFTSSVSKTYWLIARIQTYDVVAGSDKNSYQSVFYAAFKLYNQSYNTAFNTHEQVCRELMEHMIDGTISGHNYNVGDVFMIPDKLFNESMLGTEESIMLGELYSDLKFKTVLTGGETNVLSGTIQNDYKNLFIGTYDNNIKLLNNGTGIDYSIIIYNKYSSGISIKLSAANQIIDITNSFKYDVPFSSITAAEYQQRKIAVELEKNNLELDLDETQYWVNYGTNMLKFVQDIVRFKPGSAFEHFTDAYYKEPFITRGKLWNKLDAVKAPQYSNVKGIAGNANNIANYVNGVFIAKINADNETFVKDSINNLGYIIYHYTNDFSSLNIKTDMYNTIHYDFIRFDAIDIYGSFPREIALTLNDIFEKGVKVWYDEEMTEDNYVV